jgi:hypothetical protein
MGNSPMHFLVTWKCKCISSCDMKCQYDEKTQFKCQYVRWRGKLWTQMLVQLRDIDLLKNQFCNV